jgi:hypothetical protein
LTADDLPTTDLLIIDLIDQSESRCNPHQESVPSEQFLIEHRTSNIEHRTSVYLVIGFCDLPNRPLLAIAGCCGGKPLVNRFPIATPLVAQQFGEFVFKNQGWARKYRKTAQIFFDSVQLWKRYILGFLLRATQDNANLRCLQGISCG